LTLNINGFFPGTIQPSEVVGGCINIYENIWPNPEETIKIVENLCSSKEGDIAWRRAETIGSGPWQSQRTNSMLPVTYFADLADNGVLQSVHNQFYVLLLATTNPYCQTYGINEPIFHEGYSLLKYSGGQEYKGHYDGTSSSGRIISALVYLNDDYEGGEIEFPFFGIKIKPQAGMLILFPSNFAYTHVAHPITSGTKYALVTWLRDRREE
jgi:hypothetical protein